MLMKLDKKIGNTSIQHNLLQYSFAKNLKKIRLLEKPYHFSERNNTQEHIHTPTLNAFHSLKTQYTGIARILEK
jgi:hypothetical protein